MLDFDDDLFAIEMSIVSPPYLLDFASAIIDRPSDLIEDEGNTIADLVTERFGARAPEVLHLQQQLADRAGLYITDLHPHNIKFAPQPMTTAAQPPARPEFTENAKNRPKNRENP